VVAVQLRGLYSWSMMVGRLFLVKLEALEVVGEARPHHSDLYSPALQSMMVGLMKLVFLGKWEEFR